MIARRRAFNPKRRFCPEDLLPDRQKSLAERLQSARYAGNPEHKRNPGDFGLDPPRAPRPGKSLCDSAGIFRRSEALALLKTGLGKGMFSLQEREGWPQNVWAVTENGEPVEAQLEAPGVYHSYPMPKADPFRERVLERWNSA